MPYRSVRLLSDCSLKVESLGPEIATLLEQGIALCARWEVLAQEQWNALQGADLAGLAITHSGQLQLMREFQMLAVRWDAVLKEATVSRLAKEAKESGARTDSSLPKVQDPGLVPGLTERDPPAKGEAEGDSLSKRGRQFVTAAQRVAALNKRNTRAFAALLSITGLFEVLVAGHQLAYGPDGAPATDRAPLSVGFDRQG